MRGTKLVHIKLIVGLDLDLEEVGQKDRQTKGDK